MNPINNTPQRVFWAGIGVSIAGIILAWLLKPAIKRSD
jgi:hypothetical protein